MGMDDNYHKILDAHMALVDTPLIAPSNSYYPHHHIKTALYPYNLTTTTTYHKFDHSSSASSSSGGGDNTGLVLTSAELDTGGHGGWHHTKQSM